MTKLVLCLVVVLSVVLGGNAAAPNIWPLPTSYSSGTIGITVGLEFSFDYTISSTILDAAVARYAPLIFPHQSPTITGNLNSILIAVASTDDTLQYGVDESYTLTIPSGSSSASLSANTVYGALRGMETLSQLITFDFTTRTYVIANAPWTITDSPRFSHRGILVDTARHFEPVPTLLKVLDSMSYAKFNTLHWHVVDSQSNPFESRAYPHFWDSSYSPEERYTQEDMQTVVAYAKNLGIRVMVEFDGPGHAESWCTGYPGVCPNPPSCLSPLDPSTENVFTMIDGIVNEVGGTAPGQGIFPEGFIHFGGDEVNTDCWTSTPRIASWLQANNYTADDAYMYFIERVHKIAIARGHQPVNWEEVFNHFGSKLDSQTIVHIWLDHATLAKVVAAGYRGILSNNDVWYLDHLDTTWSQFYLNEPFAGITDPGQQKLVLGGEVCMWGETVDTSDIFSTIWPRAAAAAERLWSPQAVNDTTAALPRLEYFRCLLNQRGINAAPTNNADARSAPPNPGGCYVQ